MMNTKKMENQRDKRLEHLKSVKEKQYGPFSSSMNKVAAAWNILLKDQLRLGIEGWQVALMYAQAKLIRITHSYKEDSYDDCELYLLQSKEMQQPINEKWIEGYLNWKKTQKVKK